MENLFVQFKSGRTLEVKDICDYVESQDFDVVVSRGDKEEAHVTIFHDAVEYMMVNDQEDVVKEPDDFYMTEIDKFDKRPIVKGENNGR